jgi:hypothetical protein
MGLGLSWGGDDAVGFEGFEVLETFLDVVDAFDEDNSIHAIGTRCGLEEELVFEWRPEDVFVTAEVVFECEEVTADAVEETLHFCWVLAENLGEIVEDDLLFVLVGRWGRRERG